MLEKASSNCSFKITRESSFGNSFAIFQLVLQTFPASNNCQERTEKKFI